MSRRKGSTKFADVDRQVLAVADLMVRENPGLSVEAAIAVAVKVLSQINVVGNGTFDSTVARIFQRLRQPEEPTIPATGRGRPLEATVIPYGAHNAIQECRFSGPGEPIPYEAGIALRRRVKTRRKQKDT